MRSRNFLTVWILAFGFSAILASILYVLAPLNGGLGRGLSWVLWPGIGLYTFFNGSLLFGGGFGDVGNCAVIALGAAVAWASLATLLLPIVVSIARTCRR